MNLCISNAQVSSTVEFVKNTDTFIENSNYKRFINETVPYINAHSDEIDHILLVGSFSPEGNIRHNTHLANLRANKIYSFIKDSIQKSKVNVNNDYTLFLTKTGLDESEYSKLRATYIEIVLKEKQEPVILYDTIYVEKHIEKIDTVYVDVEKPVEYISEDKLVMSIYNNLAEDLLIRPNLGIEVYFCKMSFFVEGSFSNWTLFGKKYNIDVWTTGFRKYFNNDYNKVYVELYARGGYYDTDIFNKKGAYGTLVGCGLGVGYKFNICSHWKITPCIRLGFDNYKFKEYYQQAGGGDAQVSFDIYTDGRQNNEPTVSETSVEPGTTGLIKTSDRTINKDFYKSCNNMFWFGPTYIGVTIQRDFYIHKKIKK